ncbi:hypothetical protein [Terasakiella sp. SH-1]|uniref:hypothetical protein n=1 Tax=Terasakiella sp. SH-1 TaxID=2560057 RepID=UPI0010745267|nr:hypothetical protein [Terasakiella sp. SH-1]
MSIEIGYPRFIDFEASGFGENSYPIEVAWNNAAGDVSSFLINIDSVPQWTYWDPVAEKDAHGISQKTLIAMGDPISVIIERMNERLAGEVVYCDAPQFDGFWLKRLFDAAGERPRFKLGSAIELFDLHVAEEFKKNNTTPSAQTDRYDRIIDTLGLQAWKNIKLTPHRAAHDVRHLMETYKLLLQSGGQIPAE